MSKKATEKEVEKARFERKWKHLVNVITAFQSKIQLASQGGIFNFPFFFLFHFLFSLTQCNDTVKKHYKNTVTVLLSVLFSNSTIHLNIVLIYLITTLQIYCKIQIYFTTIQLLHKSILSGRGDVEFRISFFFWKSHIFFFRNEMFCSGVYV